MPARAALIHPGEILLTEFMKPLGLTAYRLAKEIRVPAPQMGDIVRGKRAISADTALRLGIYFGLPPRSSGSICRMSTIFAAPPLPRSKGLRPGLHEPPCPRFARRAALC